MKGPAFETSDDNGTTWRQHDGSAWNGERVKRHMALNMRVYVESLGALFARGEWRIDERRIMRLR